MLVEQGSAVVGIHIIEDDWGVRDALVELVRGFGHAVMAYADGEAFFQEGEFGSGDLVFIDLGLPGMGGQEVIKRLVRLEEPPRIVAISGRSRGDIDAALRDLPGTAVLRKPLAPELIAAFL
jgi:FixJ family two-component response regulator